MDHHNALLALLVVLLALHPHPIANHAQRNIIYQEAHALIVRPSVLHARALHHANLVLIHPI